MSISIALGAPILVLTSVFGQGVPPSPTFDQRVDYHDWYNEYVCRGKKDNALALYESLAPDGGQMLDWRTNRWVRFAAKQTAASGGAVGRGIPSASEPVRLQMQEVLGKRWRPEAYAELAQYLDECKPHLEMLREVSAKRDFWQPIPREIECLDFVAMPYLGATRELARAALAEATRIGSSGSNGVIGGACRVLRMSRHIRQGSFTLSTLVACSERDLANQMVLAALTHGSLGAADVERALSSLWQEEQSAFGLSRPFVMEWAVALDLLQWICPEGEVIPERWKWYVRHMEEVRPREFSNDSPPDRFDPRIAVDLINRHYTGLHQIARKPLSRGRLGKLREFEKVDRPRNQDHPFCRRTVVSLARAYELVLQTETRRRATLLVLALHAYHEKNDRWPDALDSLDLPDQTRLRVDPFGARGFVYRLSDGEPTLYSVSVNGKDDGGRHDPKWGEEGKDFVFWPVPPP